MRRSEMWRLIAQKYVRMYIFSEDIGELVEEFNNRNLVFEKGLHTTNYKIKEFVILAPSVNRIVFGHEE